MSHLQASRLFSVQDRVVVITGGGSGLGRIIAQALAINGASKIFVLGRRAEALRETAALTPQSEIIPVQCDVTSKESLQAAYQAVAAQTKHVDVLFANSGVMGPLMRSPQPKEDGSLPSLSEFRETLFNVPMDEFTKVMDVNVTGAYYTVLAFLPLLEAANQRRVADYPGAHAPPTALVVITSSIAGYVRKPPFSFAYNASKAATTHLVKMLSSSLTAYDIRVNGIAPGLYQSDMSDHVFKDQGIEGGGITDDSVPRSLVPLGRSGSEQDFAGMVVWLASAAGGYINGSMIVTDGGRVGSIPATY